MAEITPLTVEHVAAFIEAHPGLDDRELLGALGYRNIDSDFGPDWPRLYELLKVLRKAGLAHRRSSPRPDHPVYKRSCWYPGPSVEHVPWRQS